MQSYSGIPDKRISVRLFIWYVNVHNVHLCGYFSLVKSHVVPKYILLFESLYPGREVTMQALTLGQVLSKGVNSIASCSLF